MLIGHKSVHGNSEFCLIDGTHTHTTDLIWRSFDASDTLEKYITYTNPIKKYDINHFSSQCHEIIMIICLVQVTGNILINHMSDCRDTLTQDVTSLCMGHHF